MDKKSYTLEPGQKATPVMIGTPDTLLWGDLITREQVRISAFLNTLAEDYVPLHDARILFLAAGQQTPPLVKASIWVKKEEILFFYATSESEPTPEETATRRLEPLELYVASWQIRGSIMKSPIADMTTMLLVAKEEYLQVWQAAVHHAAKPWLGTFQANLVQVRMSRMIVAQG